ncbi:cytochrome P450 [Streptomyces sp. NPDC047002]|uniref:cytochrome P450 n=1 Tax=Streptomyces sp. NPDC047002 TaxID=3155475 RepID=UPI00345117A7
MEELLRYFTIVETAVARVAAGDVEIGGGHRQDRRGGHRRLALRQPGPAAFGNPDTLDRERGARHHIAFGYGPHQCPGQNLARVQLQIVLSTLFRRASGLRLAAPARGGTISVLTVHSTIG